MPPSPTTERATLVRHCRVGALLSHNREGVLWSFTAAGGASGSLAAEGVLWSLTVEGGGYIMRGPNVVVGAKNLAVVVGTTPLAFTWWFPQQLDKCWVLKVQWGCLSHFPHQPSLMDDRTSLPC